MKTLIFFLLFLVILLLFWRTIQKMKGEKRKTSMKTDGRGHDADAARNMELEAALCVITVFQLRPTEDEYKESKNTR